LLGFILVALLLEFLIILISAEIAKVIAYYRYDKKLRLHLNKLKWFAYLKGEKKLYSILKPCLSILISIYKQKANFFKYFFAKCKKINNQMVLKIVGPLLNVIR
jgi:hypothetical protein